MEGLMINRSLVTREQAASPTDTARELAARVPAPIEQILFEVKRLIVGQDRLLERLLIALLSGGHVLLEGVPGLAKTVTVKAFAQVIGGAAGRIQFTPRPRPRRSHRHPHLQPGPRRVLDRARPGVLQPATGRRDQPRARQGA